MQKITFITWNQHKADYLAKFLGYPVDHVKLDLDELQSMDLHEIVTHKAQQAYDILQKPVLINDISLGFDGLGGLPWPFIRFFVDHTPLETVCCMVDSCTRSAKAISVYGYCDGTQTVIIQWELLWSIAQEPAGDWGFWWDKIFIPEWYNITRAELSPEDDEKTYLQLHPFDKLKEFLETR